MLFTQRIFLAFILGTIALRAKADDANKTKIFTQALRTYMDAYYSIEVSVGLPAADTKKFGDVYQPEQMFSLTLTSDVGMPNPWIPSVQCKLCCNPGNVWYDKQKSTVFNSTNTYANDTLSGEYGTDRLTFWGNSSYLFPVDDTLLFLVSDVRQPNAFTQQPFDGTFNLFSPYSAILKAAQNGTFNSTKLTVFLKRTCSSNDSHDAGVVTYGWEDTVNCESDYVFQQLTEHQSAPRTFRLDAVSVERTTIFTGWQAAPSMDPDMRIPKSVFDELNKVWNAKAVVTTRTDTIRNLTYTLTSHTIACNAPQAPITLKKDDACYLRVQPTETVYASAGQPIWELGLPFARQYCHVYAISENKIGFATAKQSLLPHCVYNSTVAEASEARHCPKSAARTHIFYVVFFVAVILLLL